MDRLKNYFNNWATGQKLTPTQRDDFKQLSNELYAAAGQAYNQKRQEYQDYGQSFNLDASKALGAPAQIPSLMRGGPGGAERKPLGSIFQR
jgi:Spy/CpxP family protein refolding chaperone